MQPARTSIKPAAAEAEIAQIRIVSWMQRRGSTAGMARHPTGRSGNASEILPMQTQRYNFEAHPRRESGGIGRRTRLRIWRGNPWGFESPLSHQCLRWRSLAVPVPHRLWLWKIFFPNLFESTLVPVCPCYPGLHLGCESLVQGAITEVLLLSEEFNILPILWVVTGQLG